MPEVRALKTFNSRFGLIRAGTVFQCPPDYFRALSKNKLVELEKPDPAPDKNRSVAEAPNRGGKGGPAPGSSSPGTGHPPASGKGATSSSARAGQASRSKTSPPSAGGAVTSKSVQKRQAAQKDKKPPDA